jgi:hypothetical protein
MFVLVYCNTEMQIVMAMIACVVAVFVCVAMFMAMGMTVLVSMN